MFVGHDWGSMVVWQLALLHPERVAGVVGMSVPFLPRAPMPPVQLHAPAASATRSSTSSTSRSRAWPTPSSAPTRPRTMRRLLAGAIVADAGAVDPSVLRRRRPRLRRPHPRARRALPDWLTPGRARPLRRRVHPHRLHRRHQLVPQLRPQLGADRAARPTPRSTVPSLFIGGAPRPGAGDEPARRSDGRGSTTTAATVLDRRRRPLGAAGEAGRGQRRPPRLPRRPHLDRRPRPPAPLQELTCPLPGPCGSARSSRRSTPSGRARRSPSSTTSSASCARPARLRRGLVRRAPLRRLRADRLPRDLHRRRRRAHEAHQAGHRRRVAAVPPPLAGGRPPRAARPPHPGPPDLRGRPGRAADRRLHHGHRPGRTSAA